MDEQSVFDDSDLDSHDRDSSTIALLGYSDGIVVGTVRLFLLDPGCGPLAGRPARRALAAIAPSGSGPRWSVARWRPRLRSAGGP